MLFKLLETLDHVFDFEKAQAHCDIPCGIYDPHGAQIAALTVIRMIDLIGEMKQAHQPEDVDYINNMPRYVMVKDQHAELAKREIGTIFGDYMKQEQLDKFPELPGLVHKILQLGSKARQTADRQVGMDLLNGINRFAEIYWATKNIQTKRVKAPYKPGEEIVYPML
jgi:nickel superoxide dismutase